MPKIKWKMDITSIKLAARYYLQCQSMAGTTRQVEDLLNRYSGSQIMEMAVAHGYKA